MKLKLAVILFAALIGPVWRFSTDLLAEKLPTHVAVAARSASTGGVSLLPYQIVSLPRACDCPCPAVTAPITSATAVQCYVGTGAAMTSLSLASTSTDCTSSQLVRSANQ